MRGRLLLAALAAIGLVSGCAVVAVADTAATVTVKAAGVAADTAIGAAKITGQAVGAAADAAFGSDED